MRKRQQGRNPLFCKRWFPDDVIILCVRWYLRFRLSCRDLSSIAAEMGVAVAPSTILRWVIRISDEFARRWEPFKLVVGGSWRADETYIKVNGGWVYLYRAGDRRAGKNRRPLSEPQPRSTGCSHLLSESIETPWTTAQHHVGRFRAQSRSAATHGHAERVQLPRSQSGEDSILQILEQHGGAGSSPCQIQSRGNARIQVVLERPHCTCRDRADSEIEQRTVWRSSKLR